MIMANENVDICPICSSTQFIPFLVCTDFTTTQESFSLIKCQHCSLVLTSPRPNELSMGRYYESDKYISHTGKSSAFFDYLYLFARAFTLRWKTSLIKKYNHQPSLLDYGCGTGEFLKICSSLGWETFGVEPSHLAKAKAIELTKLNIKSDLVELEGQKFDVITLWHVLEHVSDLREKIIQLKHLLKPSGIIFVAVPNHESYDASVYCEYWAGFDVPRHLWHFSRATMTKLLDNEGLKLDQIKPMRLDAFYVCLLSEKYKSGTSTIGGIFKAIITGFVSNIKARSTADYSSLIYIIKQ